MTPGGLDLAARKAGRRLLPFLLLLYIAAFLDRVNIGYVKVPFLRDTGMSEAAFAFGAGIFFVTYALFEIPSNLILFRVGARLWIGRIMISWGIVAAALMFVRGASSFYVLRAALGLMEAGFFPGIILYLSIWFPARQRAPMLGLFYIGAPCAQILGGPISGLLLGAEGRMGLHGWQWVFLSEGLLAVVLGVATLLWLTNRPAEAKWLTAEERLALQGALDEEERGRVRLLAAERGSTILANGRVWRLGVVYALMQVSVYGVTFYLPAQVGRLMGLEAGLMVGIISTIPWCCALLAAFFLPRLLTRPGRTALVAGLTLACAAVGIWVASTSNPVLGIAGLSVAAAGFIGAQPVFWTMPTAELSGADAAAGIALINSLGAVGGFIAPNLRVSAERIWHNSPSAGSSALAATTVLGAVLIFLAARRPKPV